MMTNPTDTLSDLRQRQEALRLRAEILALERRLATDEQLARAVDLREGWGQIVDRREHQFDTPGFDLAQRLSRAADRRHGRNVPHFETEQDLAEMRGVARWFAATDETSIGIIENLTNYVIGTGFCYTAVERMAGEAPAGLVETVQQIVDRFIDANNWRRVEREAFVRSRRDGEFFLRLMANGPLLQLRFVEPDLVRKPDDPRFMSDYAGAYDLDWEFGVATELGDTETVYGYHIDWSGDGRDWQYIPADAMIHAKLNVDMSVKRGMSDFYAAASEIGQAAKLAHNTAEGAAIQATIAYIKEAATGTAKPDIEAHRTANTDWTVQQPVPDGGTRTARYEKFHPGRVITTAGMKYHAGPLGTSNAPTFIDVVQLVLRRVGQRWAMPEYMVSGDASNANYSSTLVAESPFVKAAEAQQVFYEETFRDLFWKMLRMAHTRDAFSRWRMDFEQLRRAVKLKLEAPRVSVRDRSEETSIRSTLHAAGVLSKKTWAMQEDLDYDTESRQLAQENSR